MPNKQVRHTGYSVKPNPHEEERVASKEDPSIAKSGDTKIQGGGTPLEGLSPIGESLLRGLDAVRAAKEKWNTWGKGCRASQGRKGRKSAHPPTGKHQSLIGSMSHVAKKSKIAEASLTVYILRSSYKVGSAQREGARET